MNSTQIHLGLTHVPVVLSMVGFVVLAIAMIRKNSTLTKTAFYILLCAGILTIPVFLTGEGAEETVERLPGVSEGVIEEHEELAGLAFGAVSVAAFVSLAGLLLYKNSKILSIIKPLVLILSLATVGIMTVTAHLGGQVRHSEIRPRVTDQTQNNEVTGSQNGDKESNE